MLRLLSFTGLVVALVACGARTGLDVPGAAKNATSDAGEEAGLDAEPDSPAPEDATVGRVCTPVLDAGAPAICSSWRAGDERVVSASPAAGQGSYLTSAVPAGDGVLVTWFELTAASQSTWVTRRLGFDGVPDAPARDHLSFATTGGIYTDVMSLAGNGCAFAGVVDDDANGCRFLPLDGDGNETGAVVSPSMDVCFDLGAAAPGGFSMITASSSSESSPVQLLTVDPAGHPGLTATLLPSMSAGLSPRLLLRDGSFLLSTFTEVDSGALATDMRHFAPDGTLLAGPFTLSDTAYSILYMTETSAGVLAAYQGDANEKESVIVLPLDHDGRPTAAPVPVVASEYPALYGEAIGSAPGGDALVAWQSLQPDSTFKLEVQALAPDGTPRGAPTTIGTYDTIGTIRIVESVDGTRGVLLFMAAEPSLPDGMRAVPLFCVP